MSRRAPVTSITALLELRETTAEPRPYSAVEDIQ